MDFLTSLRRTIIPFVMGWVAHLPIAPYIDAAEVEAALVVLLGGVYYAVARFFEEQGYPVASYFIAFGKVPSPVYYDTGVLAEVNEDDRLDIDGGDGSVANS